MEQCGAFSQHLQQLGQEGTEGPHLSQCSHMAIASPRSTRYSGAANAAVCISLFFAEALLPPTLGPVVVTWPAQDST